MRKLVLIAAASACLAMAMLAASPAFGGAKVHVVTDEHVAIGAPTGTFTFSGDVSDSGTFVFDSFLSAGPPAFFLSTEHVIQRYLGASGSLTVEKQCLTVYLGGGAFSDTCQAAVLDGSGAYEGEHGGGTCSGLISLVTGIASQSCDLRLS